MSLVKERLKMFEGNKEQTQISNKPKNQYQFQKKSETLKKMKKI